MTQIPTRLRALMGLTDLIKTVTPANGYQHDLGDFDDAGVTKARVFRGRALFGADDPLPMVVVLERPAEDMAAVESPRGAEIVRTPWDLLVQGFVDDDKDNPTDPAHLLMADVKLALIGERMKLQRQGAPRTVAELQAPDLLGMNGAVADILVGGGVVRPPDDTSAKAMFWLPLTLDMAEDASNPFA